MEDIRAKIDKYFEEHKEEMISDISRLVSIKSCKQEELPGMPYGKGSAEALACALSMFEAYGFKSRNYENHVITADLNNNDTVLGILAHLDVVPEGDGWSLPPYEATIRDGRIYGRGTSDDKGPAMAALYAMIAAREIAPGLTKNVRLILGGNEESGSDDITYYFSKEKAPPMTFSPDAEFPVINIEKGSLKASYQASWAENECLPRIISVKGGVRINVVPPAAEAVIEGFSAEDIKSFCDKAGEKTGVAFSVEPVLSVNDNEIIPPSCSNSGKGILKVIAKGEGAHASTPDEGNNAITALLTLLSSMPFAASEGFEKLCAVSRIFPHNDYYGAAAGVAMEDSISGKLTMNPAILEFSLTGLKGSLDSRTPICANDENVGFVIRDNLAVYGIRLDNTTLMPPHHTPEESVFVQTLLKTYEDYTGLKGSCLAIGGGTYVHDIEGGVAFGCSLPGTKNNIHGADEFAVIDELVLSARIFTNVIIELCS